jgi:hypothetical protein
MAGAWQAEPRTRCCGRGALYLGFLSGARLVPRRKEAKESDLILRFFSPLAISRSTMSAVQEKKDINAAKPAFTT